MKKTYMAPEANTIKLYVEESILFNGSNISDYVNNEKSVSVQLSNQKGWDMGNWTADED